MKKIFKTLLLILTISLFVSCSDDDNKNEADWTNGFDNWNSPDNPNYTIKGYNPLEGVWVKENSKDPATNLYNHVFIFSKKFKFQECHYISAEKRWGDILNLADYIINDKEFKLDTKYTGVDSRRVFRYRIENDKYLGKVLYINFPGENTYNIYYDYSNEWNR